MVKYAKKDGLLNEVVGVNQILPIKYEWAWQSYLNGCANNWMPTEVQMQKDIEQWKSGALTDDEKLVIKRCMGFFAGSESLVSNNLLLSIFRWVTNPECRQYIVRQTMEEALHNHTVVYVCHSLNLDIKEVYEAYSRIPSIKAKDDFLMGITSDINRPDFSTDTIEGKKELLRNILAYYIICEGILFYSGFAMLLSFGRQNKMKGIAEQIQYTLRDESLHIEFGTNLINTIKQEYPDVWTDDMEKEFIGNIEKAVQLEIEYANDILPRGVLGLNASMFIDYIRYIANRRLRNLNINHQFQTDDGKEPINPFPWMSEVIDLEKNKNFFETRVTNYKVGAVDMDDF